MSNITQFLFRRGSDASRQTTLLAQGEPGFTTDSKRLFVGDGATPGGVIAGNINYGVLDAIVNGENYLNSGLTKKAYTILSAAQIGDLFYEVLTNNIYSLSAKPNGTPNAGQLYIYHKNITLSASEFFFGPNSLLTLQTNGISGFHISPTAVDQVTLTRDNNKVLAAQIGSPTTGIANTNLRYAPANSIKGNFTTSVNSVTDKVLKTGNNVYQFIGTASNTQLGVIGLSAGQNITFTTVPGVVESDGQALTAVVIDSTPNLEAGNGIIYNKDNNSGHYAISTYNSLEYIPISNLHYTLNSGVCATNLFPGDGTAVPVLCCKYVGSSTASLTSIPVISFQTVARTSNPPALTIYWAAAQTGGSTVSVFATNSAAAYAPSFISSNGYFSTSPRGNLFPSYWQDFSWVTSSTHTSWTGGDSGNKDGQGHFTTTTTYTTNTIMANWPADVRCMYLSGTRLWIGGNFMNIGNTVPGTPNVAGPGGAVRYGVAVIDLQAGANDNVTNTGRVGQVVNLTGPANINGSPNQGLNALNGTPGYGLTQLSPGYTVRQILAYRTSLGSSILCTGGTWSQNSNNPSISVCLFDITNGYKILPFIFKAYGASGDTPATITSMISGGDYLYITGNFYKAKLASDTDYTVCPGITRIKMNNFVGGSIAPIIDTGFTATMLSQIYTPGTSTAQTYYKYPINTLCMVPCLNDARGGYVLYAGGSHWSQSNTQTGENYRYHNLTTHWIGRPDKGPDGSLTNFNCIVNGPVNVITQNPYILPQGFSAPNGITNSSATQYQPDGLVYVGGAFTKLTSQRLKNQQQYFPANNVVALDTSGYLGLTNGGGIQGTDPSQNGNAGIPYSQGSTYTSADAPHVIDSWVPAFDGPVTGIAFHEYNDPVEPAGFINAIYFTGLFTAVGQTKAPYAAAIAGPAPGYNFFAGLSPAPWFPYPNTPFTSVGGPGTNILRIPYTSPLSGVVLSNTSSFDVINGNVRPGFARVTGVNELPIPPLSSVLWCAGANVMGQGAYINIDDTYMASLSDPVIAPGTTNSVRFSQYSFPALYRVHRGDLCRFVIYRPGAMSQNFFTGTNTDTYALPVYVLGVSLDWDTGTAVGNFPTRGYSTFYGPPSATSNIS
jgi:Major tropism determinant N-terminal domain